MQYRLQSRSADKQVVDVKSFSIQGMRLNRHSTHRSSLIEDELFILQSFVDLSLQLSVKLAVCCRADSFGDFAAGKILFYINDSAAAVGPNT